MISSPANQYPTPLTGDNIQDSDLSDRTRADLEQRPGAFAKERVCSKYRTGKCILGLRGIKEVNGEKCPYDHPKKCNRFCSFGNTNKGCKKGEQCDYFCTVLCMFSVQKRLCTNEECTHMHLKGTRRNAVNFSKFNSKLSGEKGLPR